MYRSPNIVRVIKSRRLRWAGHVACIGGGRSALKILTGKPIGQRPLGRPRLRRKENFRMDLKEIGVNTRNWVNSAQDKGFWRAFVNSSLKVRVPLDMKTSFSIFTEQNGLMPNYNANLYKPEILYICVLSLGTRNISPGILYDELGTYKQTFSIMLLPSILLLIYLFYVFIYLLIPAYW